MTPQKKAALLKKFNRLQKKLISSFEKENNCRVGSDDFGYEITDPGTLTSSEEMTMKTIEMNRLVLKAVYGIE